MQHVPALPRRPDGAGKYGADTRFGDRLLLSPHRESTGFAPAFPEIKKTLACDMPTTLDRPTPREAFPFKPYRAIAPEELTRRIEALREQLGKELLILGHHYQQDEVIALSDLRGDSYQLSKLAAEHTQCRAIVFCGVHFMAETADVLANQPERMAQRGGQRIPVVLPDLSAGCSMADMARIEQVEACWAELATVIDVDDVMPVTYVNSAASLKAFCGRRGGIVCTSANAAAVLQWAFARRRRVLFFPDQHLGRNTALAMGVAAEQMPVWDPREDALGGNTRQAIADSRVVLWKGHCSVHQLFLPAHVDQFRQRHPGIKILVHPECMREVVERADFIGSTGRIIDLVCGSAGRLAVGNRHRTAPRQPTQARAPGAGNPLPLAHGLHVRDDVSHRSAAPLLGAGEPCGRYADQRHPRGRRNGGTMPWKHCGACWK